MVQEWDRMGQQVQRSWDRNQEADLEDSKEARELLQTGRDHITWEGPGVQSLMGCGVKFGLSCKGTGGTPKALVRNDLRLIRDPSA